MIEREYSADHRNVHATYYSVREFIEDVSEADNILYNESSSFAGGSWDEARELASHGWEEGVIQASPIMEEALKTLEQELDLPIFKPRWDVAGNSVDIGAYLTGDPACMVTMFPVHESKSGKVVTLVVSLSVSASISTETMLKRGVAVLALALALQACQYETEIWVDETGKDSFPRNGGQPRIMSTRILLKSAHDSIRDEELAYWLAHPTAFRRWLFAAIEKQAKVHGYPCPSGLGIPREVIAERYPDGAIITPHLRSNYDQPDAAEFVMTTLRELGIIE